MTLWASPEVDRQYSLESVGVLRPWDNVDGLFADYLRDSFKEYFAHQTRYRYQDISQADPILLKSKIPYAKLIEDPQILRQLARSMKAESLIRTKVFKEGHRYRLTLDWIHSASLDVLSTETFGFSDPEPGQAMEQTELSQGLHHAIDSLMSKLPFVGQVTGRDREWVTVSLSRTSPVKKGDQLVISTIDQVKRHPLLNQIVEWQMSEVGRLEVDQIDQSTIFCRIVSQAPDKAIIKYQKITKVYPAPAQQVVQSTAEDDLRRELEEKRYEPPRTGWISGGPWLGSFSRDNSSLNSTSGFTGGGFLYGATADGQLWLDRNIFFDLCYGYGVFSYTQQNIQTGATTSAGSVSGSASRFNIDVGYSYLVSGSFWGPKFFGKMGYHNFSYHLPDSSTEQTGSAGYGSFFIGVGGDLPIRDEYGAELNLDLGLIHSQSNTGFSPGAATGISDIHFYIGGYYRFAPRISLKIGVDVQSQGTDFDSGTSLSDHTISFGPQIQYYF
jgi:hypothetical protein